MEKINGISSKNENVEKINEQDINLTENDLVSIVEKNKNKLFDKLQNNKN